MNLPTQYELPGIRRQGVAFSVALENAARALEVLRGRPCKYLGTLHNRGGAVADLSTALTSILTELFFPLIDNVLGLARAAS